MNGGDQFAAHDRPRTIEWMGGLDGYVSMIDQTQLPQQLRMLQLSDVEGVRGAIKRLSVRGAPAIGIAAAMGLVLGVRHVGDDGRERFLRRLDEVADDLAGARPTAVNLVWALQRMRRRARRDDNDPVGRIKEALLAEAKAIRDEDAATCHAIGQVGGTLITDGSGVLTHCNAGALATAEYGTALAVMYAAHEQGCRFRVWVDETRPLLQGSRLTAWELQRAGIDVTVICDNMAAVVMRRGEVNLVITGADRIAANGDVANKIGTYGLALLAEAHDIPFYVAAPRSTFDLALPTGNEIPIEERSPDEIRHGFGVRTAPDGVPCFCPAFDVTPARLVRGIVTERGIISPVDARTVAAIVGTSPAGDEER